MRRGISLLELLVTIFVVAIVTGALTRVFVAGLRLQANNSKSFDSRANRIWLEDTVTRLIRNVNLHGDGSYFISPVPSSSAGLQQPPQDSPLGVGTSSLVMTTSGEVPPATELGANDQSFEGLNARFGPMSDRAEVSLSMVPVGDAGNRQGLFLRRQSPADSDPTQGGVENLLNPDLRDIRFEFYDGSKWTDTWDSRSDSQKGKLPSAVRVTYLLNSEQTPRTFLVTLPTSDLMITGVTAPIGGGL